jgi:hypothetical protein
LVFLFTLLFAPLQCGPQVIPFRLAPPWRPVPLHFYESGTGGSTWIGYAPTPWVDTRVVPRPLSSIHCRRFSPPTCTSGSLTFSCLSPCSAAPAFSTRSAAIASSSPAAPFASCSSSSSTRKAASSVPWSPSPSFDCDSVSKCSFSALESLQRFLILLHAVMYPLTDLLYYLQSASVVNSKFGKDFVAINVFEDVVAKPLRIHFTWCLKNESGQKFSVFPPRQCWRLHSCPLC